MLTFNPDTHTYTLDGRKIPSVTQILTATGFINDQWFNEAAAWRGSVVHRCCELWDKGRLKESSVDPTALPYLDAWREFCAKTGFKPRTVEVPRYNAFGYCGTEDAENAEMDVDRKTGATQKWHALQLAAYAAFHPRPHARRRIAVQLKSDGRYIVTEYLPNTWLTDWAAFQAALTLTNWRKLHGC